MPESTKEVCRTEDIPLVGRKKEVDHLLEQLEVVGKGLGAKVNLISGEAGLGKTRLALEITKVALEKGFNILEGKCLHKNLTPYLPFFEALRAANLEHLISFDRPPRIEYVFLMNPAGVPLGWLERKKGDLDMMIFSGMLSAVSSFVKESMDRLVDDEYNKRILNVMGYGDFRILLESRPIGLLVVILTGQETEILRDEMVTIIETIDSKYGELLREWDGEASKVEPIKGLLASLFKKYDGIDYIKMPRDKQWRIFENIAKGLHRISSAEPVLLFLDDLQWADPSSLALLQTVIISCKRDSLFILGTYRPEEIADIDGEEHPLIPLRRFLDKENIISEVHLERLDEDAITSLLIHNIGRHSTGLLGHLVAKESEGNPFYIIEMIHFLKAEGILVLKDGNWVVTSPIEKIGLPKKIRDVIVARTSKLPKQEKDILECAVVIGEVFWTELVSGVLEMPHLATLKVLKNLEQPHKLIRRTSTKNKYIFDHGKIREVLYSELPADLRMEYHRTIVECFRKSLNDGMDEVISDLAIHACLAEHPDAAYYCERAGEATKSVFNNEEARRFYNMALKRCRDEGRPNIYEALGEVEYQAGRFEEAGSWYEMVVMTSSDKNKRVKASAMRGRSMDRQGLYQQGLDVLEKESPDPQTNPLIVAQWHSTRGWLRFRMIDLDGAEKDVMKALEIFDDAEGLADNVIDCWNTLGAVESTRGRFKEAAANFRRGLSVAENRNAYFQGIRILSNLSLCEGSLGHFSKALELAERCLLAAERTGNELFIPMSLFRKGLSQFYLGKYEEAFEVLSRALKLFTSLGTIAFITEALRRRGICLLEMGRLEDAEKDVRKALELAEGLKESYLIEVNLSEILLAIGKIDEAVILALHGADGLRKTGARAWLGIVLRDLARAYVAQDRREDAERTFREAYEDYGKVIDAWEYAQGLRWWGEALASWGMKERARENLEEARRRFKDMCATQELAKVDKAIQGLFSSEKKK